MSLVEKLDKVVAEIYKEAGGLTCGDCIHADLDADNVGFCPEHKNVLHGGAITVSAPAPKCKNKFVPKHPQLVPKMAEMTL